ncbi:UDP-3-O-(3-hydroxymyristoyl)glucosamine N-acyltransferase [Candidatus Nitrotoga sp. 1052]|uniref:UDP-3-O-(3-hydroxymyristoyl)glucosamine N-acyltransferase n=1 Tax=Candidatus Nitrotoga sp. 1052 TaxID=2886964 RepID=UPI001EF62852|nr:UDP-3-O-(3-hydroxymyristoyl)glucosamine N-acyltransferase [Candidatus Nitrotoga sp. 1052]CAH1090620.1 UDP-3-O-(3-hydroxymyristoyl)glucosamine N-acyltransferase [Candidatus Nitrotoga sp. 1052]
MKRADHSLKEIAARFGGRLLGNAETTVNQIATLESAQAGQLTFLASAKYRPLLANTRASAIIVGTADAETTALPRIISDNPYLYFAKVSAFLNPLDSVVPGIHPSAVIEEGAQIAPSAYIGPNVVIGADSRIGAGSAIMAGCSIGARVSIGTDTRLYPRVVVYNNCVLGNRLIVHSGVVIGADGFGLAMDGGRWLKIPQIGSVVIGDDVEIGANTTIDRGALDDTVIEEGVKLDNLIQIAHNVRIGAHTAIAGCVGIAGSAVIGRHCRIGGGTGILGHTQISDHIEISSYTMIGKSIREPGTYTGIFPFSSHKVWQKNAAQLRHLDELANKMKTLQDEVETLRKERS